jgi:hypothetical protein
MPAQRCYHERIGQAAGAVLFRRSEEHRTHPMGKHAMRLQ